MAKRRYLLAESTRAPPARTVLVLDEQLEVAGAATRSSADLPEAGLGRARPRGHLGDASSACSRERCATPDVTPPASPRSASPTSARPRRLWDRATGKPLHHAIVWQDRRTADRCAELKAARQGGARPRAHRAHARPVLLGHQDQLDAAQRDGLRGAGRARGARFGTIDSLSASGGSPAARARDRRDERDRARCCSTSTRSRWSDELLELFGVPRALLPEVAARAEVSARRKGVPGAARRHPDRGHRRRSAVRAVRPGVLRARRREVHLRHRRVHPDEHRRRAGRLEARPAHHRRVEARAASCATRSRARRSSPAPRCSGCATGCRLFKKSRARSRRSRARSPTRAAWSSCPRSRVSAHRTGGPTRAGCSPGIDARHHARRTSRARRSRASRCRTSTSCGDGARLRASPSRCSRSTAARLPTTC